MLISQYVHLQTFKHRGGGMAPFSSPKFWSKIYFIWMVAFVFFKLKEKKANKLK